MREPLKTGTRRAFNTISAVSSLGGRRSKTKEGAFTANTSDIMLRTLTATRYAVPLREGGSLPAVVDVTDGDSNEMFVVKFRGAGQGAKALIAELIVGLAARRVGLPVPEPALILLDDSFGRTERDPEIQDILKASVGVNAGLAYLDGAFNFNPVSGTEFITPELAADIVWLDALSTNIDRTVRNPNMMVHDRKLWLIDHGAALYFHHDWASVDESRIASPFPMIKQHVLLPHSGSVMEADERLAGLLDEASIRAILAAVPDDLLMHAPEGTTPSFTSAEENRDAYVAYFVGRLGGERRFADEAERARTNLANEVPSRVGYRR